MPVNEDDVKQFISAFFNCRLELILPDSGPLKGDIGDWDSFEHLNLLLSLEEEFGIKFQMDDISNIKTVSDILVKMS